MSTLEVSLPDSALEQIARRAADLVLESLEPRAESEFLNVEEAAELLRCERQRVYDLLSAGRLTRYKDGSRVLVKRDELVAHLLPATPRRRIGGGLGR